MTPIALFVYGTLRSRSRSRSHGIVDLWGDDRHPLLPPTIPLMRVTWVRGSLHHAIWGDGAHGDQRRLPYPVMISGGPGAVRGEVYRIQNPCDLALLDRMEGHPRYYQRCWVEECELLDPPPLSLEEEIRRILAGIYTPPFSSPLAGETTGWLQAYCMLAASPRIGPQIESGDWFDR